LDAFVIANFFVLCLDLVSILYCICPSLLPNKRFRKKKLKRRVSGSANVMLKYNDIAVSKQIQTSAEFCLFSSKEGETFGRS